MNKQPLGFTPINKAHAIAEAVFFLQFNDHLVEPLLQRLFMLGADFAEELPSSQEIYDLETIIQNNPAERSVAHIRQSVSGMDFKHFRPDGNVDWLLRLTNVSISVHCLDYSRWAKIWPKASVYLYAALERLSSIPIRINGIGLKTVDRFKYEGDPSSYDLAGLFKLDSDLVFPRAFQAGVLWHSHIGWFDDRPENGGKILNQLNIGANFVNIGNRSSHITTIDHNAVFQPSLPKTSNELWPLQAAATDGVHTLMHLMHGANKEVLLALLTPAMAVRINLEGSRDDRAIVS